MTIRILPVTEYDFERIYELEQRIFPEPYSLELLLYDFVNNPFSRYFKLSKTMRPSICGSMGVIRRCTNCDVGIDPTFKERIRSWLLHYLMDYLQEEGCERVTLEVRVVTKSLNPLSIIRLQPVAIRKHYWKRWRCLFNGIWFSKGRRDRIGISCQWFERKWIFV